MSSTSRDTSNDKKRIDNLFSRFAVYYGNLWRCQFKSDGFMEFAKKEWLVGLNPYPDAVVDQAILDCRNFYDMPPSLPQMIRVCRDIKKRESVYVPEKCPSASKAIAAEHIRQCKAFLTKSQEGETTC